MTNAKPADGTFDVPADRSRAVAAHRAHQSAWREEVLAWPPGPPTNPVARKRYERLGSCLAEQHDGQKPKHAGVNLMSPDAVEYAKTRVRELEGLGGLAETDRLWRNLLSSQPLAFSITGELRAHHEAAARRASISGFANTRPRRSTGSVTSIRCDADRSTRRH